ncbi:NADPH-dependent oxidoreductase [Microbispora triticiradicis]|uniref:NADPH-dependent oxidoreductase n=1 Tax=Microbispora triticiradicis TaxID=2200763 RepID=A0ABX9LGI0_9ACTN|nr:NAD(P)H-dependent oxidoreductase [Microbispora triticiradicis]RGA02731.1 NADPH-dependent oxidoreductase [Microbispora triticiradicis]GLW25965.1 putative reductase [Microbispora amethystogenes]
MPGDDRLGIAMIIGSVRDGRVAPLVASWFAAQAERRDDLALDVIDLAETRLPDGMRGHFGGDRPEEVTALRPRVDEADAFVVVTPEYNRSFPAALKLMIDSYHREWAAKPVGFVSYGGMSSGLRAVEQLRLVFAELHAVTVRDSVAFRSPWTLFDDDGNWPKDPAGAESAAKTMLDELVWFGRALRDARAARPYGA